MFGAKIALTVDVEGEWYELPGEQGFFDLNKIIFFVKNLEKLICEVESITGDKIPITWFIRCDDSVAAVSGVHEGLLQRLDDFIYRRLARGDEFGFHPHLYTYRDGKWLPDRDLESQKNQIYRSADAWRRYFGEWPKLSRMGEAVMNNSIAHTLDLLGVEIDSSALPDRMRFDSGFQFDWLNTPNISYHPSVDDYRIPANEGGEFRNFIEAPFSMIPVKAHYDKEVTSRYCNLAFKPALFEEALARMRFNQSLITIVHPHEISSGGGKDHPLIAYDPGALIMNIKVLKRFFGALKFNTLSQLIKYERQ